MIPDNTYKLRGFWRTMIIRKSKICHDSQTSFRRMLKAYEDIGVVLSMDGKRMSANAIADRYMVRERSAYMLDFVPDASGRKVREIHLDRVCRLTEPGFPSVKVKKNCSGRNGRRS